MFGHQSKFEDLVPVNLNEIVHSSQSVNDYTDGNLISRTPSLAAENKNPFQNLCVLANVMKYLSVWNLKTCRLVNSHWKSEASRLLRKRSVIPLNFLRYINYSSHDAAIAAENTISNLEDWVFTHESDLKTIKTFTSNQSNNFRIILESREYYGIDSPLDDEDFYSFTNLLNDFAKQIDYIELFVKSLNSSSEFPNFFQKSMQELSKFSKVTEVFLKLEMAAGFKIPWKLECLKTLPSVQHLKIQMTKEWDSSFDKIITNILPFDVKYILAYFPELKTLKITSEGIEEPNLVPEFVDEIFNYLERYKKLYELEISTCCIPSEKSLSKIPSNLKKLALVLPFVKSSTEIEKMLEKVSPNLEALKLVIPGFQYYNHRSQAYLAAPERQVIQVQMPIFPKLKSLRIEHIGNSNLELQKGSLCFAFKFVDEELVYGNQFPLLEELHLGVERCKSGFYIQNRCGIFKLYKSFFPNTGEVVENVKILLIPYLSKNDVLINAWLENFKWSLLERLDKMFPNRRNQIFSLNYLRYLNLLNKKQLFIV